MAIGSLSIDWFTLLRQRGLLPERSAVLDLGPQDVTTKRSVVERAARQLFGDDRAPAMVDEVFDGENWRRDGQLAFYRLFGGESYCSIDLSDPRAIHACDLNHPLPDIGRFDIVTDLGTSEHVFNIGQSYEIIHKLLSPNGVVLFTSPTFAFINHGFYNLHPMVFTEFAAANGYDVLDFRYIDNMFVRCIEQEQTDRSFDFDTLPIRLEDTQDIAGFMKKVVLRFQENLESAESRRLTGDQPFFIFDMLFVALRKPADESRAFVLPYQGGFGASRVNAADAAR
jgi:SAM-dependent methyltransferase